MLGFLRLVKQASGLWMDGARWWRSGRWLLSDHCGRATTMRHKKGHCSGNGL